MVSLRAAAVCRSVLCGVSVQWSIEVAVKPSATQARLQTPPKPLNPTIFSPAEFTWPFVLLFFDKLSCRRAAELSSDVHAHFTVWAAVSMSLACPPPSPDTSSGPGIRLHLLDGPLCTATMHTLPSPCLTANRGWWGGTNGCETRPSSGARGTRPRSLASLLRCRCPQPVATEREWGRRER